MRNPSPQSIIKALQVATTSEAATYFYKQFKVNLAKSKTDIPEISEVLSAVEEHANKLKDTQQFSTNSMWEKGLLVNEFQNLQKNLADIALKELGEKPVNIIFDYAINDQSQFIRGYLNEGQPVDDKIQSSMDQLFNTWLTNNQMINLDGIIYKYKSTEDSKDILPAKDAQGNSVKVDPKTFKDIIDDKNTGFAKYVESSKSSKSSMHVEARKQNYEQPENAQDNIKPAAGG